MTDSEFQEFLDSANDELQRKQEALKHQFGLGSTSRWHFEQATGNLQFFDENDQLAVEADVIDIGSYARKSSTWMWAWANDSVLPWLKQRAEKLKELESITGIALFGYENAFEVDDEVMAWEMAAMSVRHLDAAGCYRAPSSGDGPDTFLAIMAIRRCAQG
jgi:hypothetical protein